MPIMGVPRCALKNPFRVPVIFPFWSERISELDFGPSFRSLLSKPIFGML